jgi:hypothetical protein
VGDRLTWGCTGAGTGKQLALSHSGSSKLVSGASGSSSGAWTGACNGGLGSMGLVLNTGLSMLLLSSLSSLPFQSSL